MTNFKRGHGAGRGIVLGAIAALGLVLSGCGGSGPSSSLPASAAQSSTPAQQSGTSGTQSATGAQSASSGSTAAGATSAGSAGGTPSSGGSVTLNWVPPTQNVDGTPLTNLAGYNIHYGTASGQLTQTISISNPGLATYVVSNLASGTYYFAVAAVNASGTESPLSSQVSITVN